MKKKVLFLANHFITLYSFRKELIQRLVSEGHDVYLSLPESDENKYFIELGCKIVPTKIDRRGVNPIKDVFLLLSYRRIIRQIKPDLIFSYTIKPNIYGSLISNHYGCKQICNITGTGATFLRESLVSKICKVLYSVSIKNCYKVFFQNRGDQEFFIKNGLVKNNYALIPGSGCNTQEYAYTPIVNDGIIRFIYIGRVMQLKGIDEYLDCAKAIKEKYPNTEFLIAGWNEEDCSKQKVADYESKGFVKYLGFCKDIKKQIAQTQCTILASHGGEGVPNVVLESAAMGRPCIVSNVNGSVDVVENGVTGFIFETGSSKDLISKVEKFLSLTDKQKIEMGVAGRAKVEREFDRQIVVKVYMKEMELV